MKKVWRVGDEVLRTDVPGIFTIQEIGDEFFLLSDGDEVSWETLYWDDEEAKKY